MKNPSRRRSTPIVKHFGRIDVLVNAAGIPGPSARVEDYSFSDAKKVLSVNLFGTFLMMHTVLPVMQAQKHGAILNFGSVSGVVGYPFESAYGASKAAHHPSDEERRQRERRQRCAHQCDLAGLGQDEHDGDHSGQL